VDAWLVQADFDGSEGSRELFEKAVQSAGTVDFLVNSASSFTSSTIQDIDFAQLMRDMQVNAWSPFALSRQFAGRIASGKIVNLLDTRIIGYDPSHVGYILSKWILLALTEMMAIEFAPRITVNAVAPGLILPPPGEDPQYLNELAVTVPLKRHGELDDVTNAVLFLLENDFVTGQVLFIDGGRHLMELSHGPHHNQ
jgi:pteridine reductase